MAETSTSSPDLTRCHAAIERALAALNPLSGFLRRFPPRSKADRHLESVRADLRAALAAILDHPPAEPSGRG